MEPINPSRFYSSATTLLPNSSKSHFFESCSGNQEKEGSWRLMAQTPDPQGHLPTLFMGNFSFLCANACSTQVTEPGGQTQSAFNSKDVTMINKSKYTVKRSWSLPSHLVTENLLYSYFLFFQKSLLIFIKYLQNEVLASSMLLGVCEYL